LKNIDVLIIGAGAAGLTAAIFAASDRHSSKSRDGATNSIPSTDLNRDTSDPNKNESDLNGVTTNSNRDTSAQNRDVLDKNRDFSTPNPDISAQNRRILVLERTNKPGKKILMSGGTRCNVLPVQMSIDDYFTDSSKNLLKRIFKSWSVEACKTWFEHDLKLSLSCEIESNKWFPTSNSAEEVRDSLVDRALTLGVEFRYNAGISRLMQTSDGWTAIDENGAVYAAQKVIVATGGLSVPTIGTDGMGHKFLQQLGVELKQTYPALTPLTGPHPGSENLAGISMHVKIEAKSGSNQGKAMGNSNREGFLFTHKGFSGPAVLDISHLATKAVLGLGERPEMLVNWSGESPEIWKDRIKSSKSTAKTSSESTSLNVLLKLCARRCHLPIRRLRSLVAMIVRF
jgi:predicted Rossmann fold flavoprotein